MANKCHHCGKFLATADGAKCSKCPSMFHRACVNFSPESRISQKWLCKSCKDNAKKLPTSQSQSQTVDHNDDVFVDANAAGDASLVNEIKLLRTELIKVTGEMVSFRQELAKLNTCILDFNSRVDSIEERLTSLEQQNTSIYKDGNISQDVISQLRYELNDREQECLSNDLEISGLEEKAGENIIHIVTLTAKKLDVNIQDVDIVSAQRSGPRRDAASTTSGERLRPRPITVRLTRRALCDELLRAARVRRGADSSSIIDGEPRRFYVNERLTRTNRYLFYKTREESRKKGWKYTWTKGGRIYIRQDFNAPVYRVRVESDINKFFGGRTI